MLVFHTKDRARARVQDYFADPAVPRKDLNLIDEPSVLAFEFDFQDFARNSSERLGKYLGERQRLAMLIRFPRIIMVSAATTPAPPARQRLGRGERRREDGENEEAAIRAHS
ncbi:MAG: hypothetical protein A4S17_00805 [Proteobacteria bacterium HN_bin10]|nr:MAG: hypothetical protein A4S17_00805 [Proteobacteria bacterium HN_bin10]